MEKIEIEAAGEFPEEGLRARKAGKTNPLRLEKQAIRTLSDQELRAVAGGEGFHTSSGSTPK